NLLQPVCVRASPAELQSSPSTKPKLIARAHRLPASEINLHDLLTMDLAPRLVRQRSDYLLARHVDDFASRRPRVFAVEAECDPAGLFAELDALDLSRRRHSVVEDVDHFVVPVAQPDLFLSRRQPDTVSRAAVTLPRTSG